MDYQWLSYHIVGSMGFHHLCNEANKAKLSQYTSLTNGYPQNHRPWKRRLRLSIWACWVSMLNLWVYGVHHDDAGVLLGRDHTPTYHPPWGINIIGLAKGNLLQTFKKYTKHTSFVQPATEKALKVRVFSLHTADYSSQVRSVISSAVEKPESNLSSPTDTLTNMDLCCKRLPRRCMSSKHLKQK